MAWASSSDAPSRFGIGTVSGAATIVRFDLRAPVDLGARRGVLLEHGAGLLGVVGRGDGRDRPDLEPVVLRGR